jgi:methanol---5-hydroxybenzimidazolylcobamide Co-methyltransferase
MMSGQRSTMAISTLDQFMYGNSPSPVRCGRELEIGAGRVVPEINFTLPSMDISEATWPAVAEQYRSMIQAVMKRAAELHVDALLVEFETLPPMTRRFEWAAEIIGILAEALDTYRAEYGIRSALRATPNDTREFERPPRMRSGVHWDEMVHFFESAGPAGADMLAIESTGGKEVCDEALVNADLQQVLLAMGVLGCRDMAFLWKQIVESCGKTGIVPSGDTACAFGNTAMILADQGMIPKVFSTVVRAATIPRSLVAYEMGAVGPSKDCAYEGPFMKAIMGVPISMEGRTAACAHLSPLGNIAQAVCDCWSNESVSNVRLLSTFAPTVSMEQLAYDCRLMNTALEQSPGQASLLRDWASRSDALLDPQAYILQPEVVLRISKRIVARSSYYDRTVQAVFAALDELDAARSEGSLSLSKQETRWLERLRRQAEGFPASEDALLEEVFASGEPIKFIPGEYGLST